MNKMRASTKIAIGFVVLTVGGYFGYKTITDQMILTEKFTQLTPGKVNVLGVDASSGYRIVVANQVAQLVKADNKFQAGGAGDGSTSEGAIKQRVPLRDLLGTLSGDSKSAGQFVMLMNNIREDETWPTVRVVWTPGKLEKALAGDVKLEAELERDLNMKLDGRPMNRLNISAMQNGIIVEVPVTVPILKDGKPSEVVGMVQRPYKPRFVRTVEKTYENKNVTELDIAGYYSESARAMAAGELPVENIRQALKDMISKERSEELLGLPKQILGSITVLATENLVNSAEYRSYSTSQGRMHDLTIHLKDEARRRLWQYSKTRVGSQLLLVADGVAIAAPRVQHELAQSDLTITQMRDEVLLRDAVAMLNKKDTGTPQP